MRNLFLSILAMLLAVGLAADPLSCYDIQYTTNANGSSPYDGQTVEVRAIVTAVRPGSSYYIGDATGGPWSGLYVFHGNTSNLVTVGDDVILSGTISEYGSNTDPSRRLTELTQVTINQIVSQGNELPPATLLSTADIAYNNPASEPWEGVLVRLTDVQVMSSPDSYGQFKIADSSNVQTMVDDGLFTYDQTITVGDWWYMIQGLVDFQYVAGFKINPRNSGDMVKSDDLANAAVRIETVTAQINTQKSVNIITTRIKPQWGVSSYTAQIRIDPAKVLFQGLDFSNTMSAMMPVYTYANGLLNITYQSQEPITSTADGDTLIKLLLEPVIYGEAALDLVSFSYDTTNIQALTDGKLLIAIERSIAWLNITNPNSTLNIFNPELNEKVTIEYGCKSSAGINVKAIMRIYDAQGRLVATPVNKNISNALGIESIQWDGRDATMNRVPIGLYYCHLEVIDRATGHKETTVQPIVVKAVMK
jgi:hypothetical protein